MNRPTAGHGVVPNPAPATFPPPTYAWYVVVVLYLAYTLSFVDRQIIAFLVGPIRAEFQISDFQFSLLHGLAFALFYTILGIPLGWLADRANRRTLIAFGIGAWSIMTAFCGLAANYWQLFLARIGVGVGEATLGPAAYSIISDSFPKEKRGLPMSFYSAGVLCGSGLANIFGGLVVEYAMSHGPQRIPLLGEVSPWQLSFLLVGLPGILVVLLMALTVREPTRQEKRQADGGVSLAETARHLRRHAVVYLTLILGPTGFAVTNYGLMSWVPALFERSFGWNRAQIGLPFGSIIFVLGTLGLVTGGWAVQKAIQRGVKAAYSKLMVYSQACSLPPVALLMAVDSPYWTLGCIAVAIFFVSFHVGLAPAALHSVTPNEMRGQVIAVYFFVLNLIGLGGGSPAIAAMTDFYFKNDIAVGQSIAVVGTCASFLGVVLVLIGIPAYKRAIGAAAL